MFLEKLELQGFKSFAPKTTLKFDKGVTAIVGPNGSGKSNCAEAIRWVLGEQSMKALRSKKSEDIIFAGTSQKARMGMAEVSLYLNNEDGQSPIEYDHLVITRRLFRDGQSEYLINKNRVRLLDIQQLLAKSGFGQKTYSVVGQGMIDSFLRATPKERQELFEEAAGVKEYQLKRELSLQKLEQAKQNLLRVKDHLDELLPRLRSLKRQAGRARRKGEVQKELRAYQDDYFNHSWNKVIFNQKEIAQMLEKIKDEERNAEENLRKVEKNLLEIVQTQSFISIADQKEITSLHSKKNKLCEQIAILSGKIQIEKERSISLELKTLVRQKEILKKEISDFKNISEKNQNQLIDFQNRLKEKIALYQANLQKLSKLQKGLFQKEDAATPGLFEIEKEMHKLYDAEERLISRLEKVQNISELKAINLLAREYLENFKKLLLKIRKEREKTVIQGKENSEENKKEIEKLIGFKEKEEKEINEERIKLAVFQTKLENYEDQIKAKEKEKSEAEKQIGKLQENQKNREVLAKLEQEKSVAEKDFEEIQEKLKDLEGKFSQTQNLEQERKNKVIIFEKDYKGAQKFLNSLKDKRREVEILRAKVENEKALLFDEIRDDFGEVEAKSFCYQAMKSPKELSNEKTKELKEEINRLKKQFLQIGEIDPQVVSECEEVEKRYKFLTSQKEDLEKAIDSLKDVIHELDEKITLNFDQAIHKINDHFQKYFATLFGGGKAKLIKKKCEIEKKEIFNHESGKEIILPTPKENKKEEFYIEIKANPPGKKLTDLNMLSGGERALTSIALVLAIITYHPSPFIILDEADAALDEANSGRYAKIIEIVAQKTQFIAITHNRETMRKAKVLYGVTMEESGVSKLLSLNLEKAAEDLTS